MTSGFLPDLYDLCRARPADVEKVSDAGDTDVQSFGAQAFALDLQVAAKAAQSTAGGNHPMAGDRGVAALAHHRADRPRGTRRAGELGDIAVGGHAPSWNAPDNREDAPLKRRRHASGR